VGVGRHELKVEEIHLGTCFWKTPKKKVKRFASKLGIQQTFSPHHPHPKINNRVEQKSSNLAALDSINITSACHRKHPASHHAASNHHLLDSPHLAQLLEVLLPS